MDHVPVSLTTSMVCAIVQVHEPVPAQVTEVIPFVDSEGLQGRGQLIAGHAAGGMRENETERRAAPRNVPWSRR
jgi:hypothetical protein